MGRADLASAGAGGEEEVQPGPEQLWARAGRFVSGVLWYVCERCAPASAVIGSRP